MSDRDSLLLDSPRFRTMIDPPTAARQFVRDNKHASMSKMCANRANTLRSDGASSADVDSSSSRIAGSCRQPAMASVCFSPPDKVLPLGPTGVFQPCGNAHQFAQVAILDGPSVLFLLKKVFPRSNFLLVSVKEHGSCKTKHTLVASCQVKIRTSMRQYKRLAWTS